MRPIAWTVIRVRELENLTRAGEVFEPTRRDHGRTPPCRQHEALRHSRLSTHSPHAGCPDRHT